MNARNSILSLGLGALMVAAVGCGDDENFNPNAVDAETLGPVANCVNEDAAGDPAGVMLSATTTTSTVNHCLVVAFDGTHDDVTGLTLPEGWTLNAAKKLEGACADIDELATTFADTSSTAGTSVLGTITASSTVADSAFLGSFTYDLDVLVPNMGLVGTATVATSTSSYHFEGSFTVDGQTVCDE